MAPGAGGGGARQGFERRPVSSKHATPPAAGPKPGVCSHAARASGAPFLSGSTASVCAISSWGKLLTRQKFRDTRKETEIVCLSLYSLWNTRPGKVQLLPTQPSAISMLLG